MWKTADARAATLPGRWRKMPQSEYDNAADLHIYAAHAHTAAAAAHHRGDHDTAEELSSKAQDFSIAASEKTFEIAKQIRAPLRA
jgi:hypothetical protein